MAGSELDYQAPERDRVRDVRDLADQSPLRGQVDRQDYRNTSSREAEGRMSAGQRLEANGVLPQFRLFDGQENRNAMDRAPQVREARGNENAMDRSPKDRLLDPNLSPEAKLKAVEDLARQGNRSVRVKD